MKVAYFAKKETVYELYSVELPPELENASEEKIKKWVDDKAENINYEKFMELIDAENDFDYEFDIVEYN